jgi:hypothetical protein
MEPKDEELNQLIEKVAEEMAAEPERIEFGFVERIAAATLIARMNELQRVKEKLDKDLADLQNQVAAMADEVFNRAGQTRDSDTVYLLTPDAFVKQ